MKKDKFTLHPIGVINSPHKKPSETPIQPSFAKGVKGTVTLEPEYVEGLADLNGFSHIYLLYVFHEAGKTSLTVRPYLDNEQRGVFATRAPSRPNHIGMSLVRLKAVDGNTLQIEDVDILDGTPLLDIKPYSSRFDIREDVRSGWLDAIPDDEAEKRGRRAGSQDIDK